MDKYTETEPALRSGRNRGGCLVLAVALVVMLGLLMWFIIWGRAAPETVPTTVPAAERVTG
jgi:cytoskeletal protein RodZ